MWHGMDALSFLAFVCVYSIDLDGCFPTRRESEDANEFGILVSSLHGHASLLKDGKKFASDHRTHFLCSSHVSCLGTGSFMVVQRP